MQLLAGIVQLLIFQQWALLMAKAKPLDAVSLLCTNVNECKNLTGIMAQIKSQITQMHKETGDLYHTYVQSNNFNDKTVKYLCNPDSENDFPKYKLTDGSEKDKVVELYKVFHYMKTAIVNITKYQKDLNPRKNHGTLHSQLNTSKDGITAVISNLSCILCQRYQLSEVTEHYRMHPPTNGFAKKKMGCKVLKKFEHFLSEATGITDLWFNQMADAEDPLTDKR
ncbi:leukemia inhibitory factor [Hyperolius riggenbachi]|uniref:leukemia inhibitory factor n=1 Tax=Hyperolius riggenbachi TaxID=752182 RepID=UPI0035A2A8AA